jgi:hypothetical protein
MVGGQDSLVCRGWNEWYDDGRCRCTSVLLYLYGDGWVVGQELSVGKVLLVQRALLGMKRCREYYGSSLAGEAIRGGE